MYSHQRAVAIASIAISLLSHGVLAEAQVAPTCGDTAGSRDRDVPCKCGNSVITNTVLRAKDPVTRKACPADGLHVAAGVTLNLGGRIIIGSHTGTGIVVGAGSNVLNGTIRNFATGAAVNRGILTDLAVDANDDSGLVVSPSAGVSPQVTLAGPMTSVSDNGGSGIVVLAGADLAITGASTQARLSVLRNSGVGIEVRGRLTATNVRVGQNAGHGILVESNDLVEFIDSQLNDNGRHPSGEIAGRAGALVLSAPDGFIWRGPISIVRDNSGHGFILGHAADQSGPVVGQILESQIYANNIGIFVEQKNADSLRTTSTIAANNIYANRGSGVYFKTSYQGFDYFDETTFAANDIHRNAVTPAEMDVCLHEFGAMQSAAQVVFDGPIANTDLDFAAETGPDPVDYPEDHICYWGEEPALTPIADAASCHALNDDTGPIHHCVWVASLSQCRIAWEAGGHEATLDNQCDFSRNRIWNYTVEPIGLQTNHRGIAGLNGACVRARRNQVGRGGEHDFSAVDSGLGSWVDPGRICGQESTCNQYEQLPRD